MLIAMFYSYSENFFDSLRIPEELHTRFTIPHRIEILLDMPPISESEILKHGWNQEDASINITINQNRHTLIRGVNMKSTDCVRGKVGITEGLHAWRITWPAIQRGSHAILGVATADAALNADGYRVLVGDTENSWGLELDRNLLYHNNTSVTYPYFYTPVEFTSTDETIMVLDMDLGTLSFIIQERYLGVAFGGLSGKKLYPIVSVVRDSCEVTMKYMGGLTRQPLLLKELCRHAVRKCLKKDTICDIGTLFLPATLKKYLLHQI